MPEVPPVMRATLFCKRMEPHDCLDDNILLQGLKPVYLSG
jgi:hypothetical protein